MHLIGVKVSVGNAGPFFYACIRYETEHINIGLIVGLVVGIGVPLILLIVVVLVCICKRRKKEKETSDNDVDLEMSPAVADKGTPADKGIRVEGSVFSAPCYIAMERSCRRMTSVRRLSVCLSVCNVGGL